MEFTFIKLLLWTRNAGKKAWGKQRWSNAITWVLKNDPIETSFLKGECCKNGCWQSVGALVKSFREQNAVEPWCWLCLPEVLGCWLTMRWLIFEVMLSSLDSMNQKCISLKRVQLPRIQMCREPDGVRKNHPKTFLFKPYRMLVISIIKRILKDYRVEVFRYEYQVFFCSLC